MSLNQVIEVGNLTKDPVEADVGNGKAANMRLAVNKKYTDVKGKEAEITDYVDIEAWGRLAENCLKELRKGDRVIIAGNLRYDEWQDADGNTRSRHKVRAQVVGRSLEF